MLAAVSEPNRQRILQLVWEQERSAGEIAAEFDSTFGAVSQHLKVLRDCGAVTLRKDGRVHYYKTNRPALGALARYFEELWRGHLGTLKVLAEEAERAAKKRKRRKEANGG